MKFIIDHLADIDQVKKKIMAAIDNSRVPKVITIERYYRDYTDDQREALWGLAYKILQDETGNDKQDLHEYFCGCHFGWKEYEVMGQRRKKAVRTTTTDENGKRDVINTRDLAQMFELIQMVSANDLGIVIPDPDPDWKKRMREEKS